MEPTMDVWEREVRAGICPSSAAGAQLIGTQSQVEGTVQIRNTSEPTSGVTRSNPTLSMLAVLLPPVAVLAGALGVWRLGVDPGWTNQFFIPNGLLSHWQGWFAVAIGAHTSGREQLAGDSELQRENAAGRRETSCAITTE